MNKKLFLISLGLLSACATAAEKADQQMCQKLQTIYSQNPQAQSEEIYQQVTGMAGTASAKELHNFFKFRVSNACGKYIDITTMQALQSKLPRGEMDMAGMKIDGKPLAEGGLGVFAIDELKSTHPKPQKNMVYYYSDSGLGYQLKVFQNAKGGVLVEARDAQAHGDILLFLETKNKYADGDDLDSGYYVYEGLFKYNSILGIQRTVYRFREVSAK